MPRKLPHKEMAPVGVGMRGAISMSDGTQPAALREMTIELDKNVAIDATGLSACSLGTLETRDESDIRRLCRQTIVGTGLAHVAIGSPEPIRVPLTLFNGGVKDGTTTVFIRLSVQGPAPTAAVATVKLRRIRSGTYGQEAVARFPEIDAGRGSVLDFDLTIKRLFEYKGEKRSYATARCLDGELRAGIVSRFSDGSQWRADLIRSCAQRTEARAWLRSLLDDRQRDAADRGRLGGIRGRLQHRQILRRHRDDAPGRLADRL
jgi:hypothetical protein